MDAFSKSGTRMFILNIFYLNVASYDDKSSFMDSC